MSDTPRTDHEEAIDNGDTKPLLKAMRQLERELNAAKFVLSGRTVSCSQCNETAKPCDWKQDGDGNWDTSCNQCMCFDYAPPNEQGCKFCHHCGHPINYIAFTFEDL